VLLKTDVVALHIAWRSAALSGCGIVCRVCSACRAFALISIS